MRKSLVFTAAAILFALLVITVFRTNIRSIASSHLRDGNSLSVENKTRAFTLTTSARDGDDVRLSFRNDYSKAINAFTLAGGPNSGVQVDLLANDHEIAPGVIYNYRVNAMSVEPSGSPAKPLRLTILNVVFEDGTGDGDYQATLNINDRRRGEKIALTRIIPLLESASKDADSETAAGINRLKRQISDACKELAKEQSGELQAGILHGQGYVLTDIEEVARKQQEANKIDLRDELSKIKEHYQRKSARLGN